MILSDKTILNYIRTSQIIVEPFEESSLQCSSLDLRLGNSIAFYEDLNIIDIKSPIQAKTKVFEEYFIINPGEFLLASTIEYIKLPEFITAFVEGRSSLGRLGLFIENAGWVDAGFEGQITLELYNANKYPIKLYSGMRICQLVFAKLDETPHKVYKGKYLGQKGATPSKIFMDFDKK
ncbi:dCTP deaminase [Hydrogenobaculum acidophilum]